MRKESKIAIFTIITVALAIWGYKYLRGFNILAQKTILFATYEKVDGLRISTPVYIHGLQVGLVADIFQKSDDLNAIVVEMNIDKGVKIPKDAVAEIVLSSPMGGNQINLVFEGSCSGDACAKNNSFLKGVTKGMLASFVTPDEARIYMDELNLGLKSLVDTLSTRMKTSDELNKSVEDAQVILANLRSSSTRLDRILANSSSSVEKSIKNVESITGALKESNQQIKNILANAEVVSANLKDTDVKKLVGETQVTMQKLQSTLANSDKAIADLSAVLQGLRTGDGTVAMLLNDKEFADNLQVTVKQLDLLLQDIRLHPERYRRVLSKKKMDYDFTPVVDDPAFNKN